MKLSTFQLDRDIAKLKESISRVQQSPRFTNADRKTLLPYYAEQLQELRDKRARALRADNIFKPLLVLTKSGPRPARKPNPALTSADGNNKRYQRN